MGVTPAARRAMRRHVDQVIGNDHEADSSMHPVDAMVATASEPMAPLDHADAPFTADRPALAAPEPDLPFVGASSGGLSARAEGARRVARRDRWRLFVARGAGATIARRQMEGAPGESVVRIQRRRPQGHIRRASRVHLVHRDDLVCGLVERDQVPKFVGGTSR